MMDQTRTSSQDKRWAIGFVLASVIAGSSAAYAADWTQWGGPNQSFKADAKGLADSWPETGPRKIWQRDLGEGYSAILSEGERLYTMYRGDEEEIVVALDSTTGKTVWEHKYDAQPSDIHEHNFGDGPRSTPLIDGDRLYTVGVSGKLHCLNKHDGKVYWTHDIWKDYDGTVLNHGYSSSPMAYKNTVIILVGGENSSIMAFDKADGHVVWKKQSFQNSYSTPKVITVGGEDQLVTFMAQEIVGLSATTGDLKWSYEIGNRWGQNVCMPIWDAQSNMLFFSVSGAGSRGVKLTKDGDKTKVEEIWSSRKIQFYHVTSVRIGDYVYGSTGNGPNFFAAINFKTGKIAWRKRGFSKATCVYADGKFIILDEDGNLGLATATPEDLTVHSKVKLVDNGVAWTVPTIVGKNMYIRDKNTIMALDLG
jgi:outer membrane protein assembly factor BamB